MRWLDLYIALGIATAELGWRCGGRHHWWRLEYALSVVLWPRMAWLAIAGK